MPRQGYDIDAWGLGAKVAELWATGNRGRAIAKVIIGDVETICERNHQPAPTVQNLTMAITRYMQTDPVDRRRRQAKNQDAVAKIEVEQVRQIAKAQVDAAQTLQRYVERIDAEVARLEQVKEIDPKSGAPVVPSMATYYTALTGMSKEMRGWIGLLVEIKDRLWQHEQYEQALTGIVNAVRAECPPKVLEAITGRLMSDPTVAAALRNMGGGG